MAGAHTNAFLRCIQAGWRCEVDERHTPEGKLADSRLGERDPRVKDALDEGMVWNVISYPVEAAEPAFLVFFKKLSTRRTTSREEKRVGTNKKDKAEQQNIDDADAVQAERRDAEMSWDNYVVGVAKAPSKAFRQVTWPWCSACGRSHPPLQAHLIGRKCKFGNCQHPHVEQMM